MPFDVHQMQPWLSSMARSNSKTNKTLSWLDTKTPPQQEALVSFVVKGAAHKRKREKERIKKVESELRERMLERGQKKKYGRGAAFDKGGVRLQDEVFKNVGGEALQVLSDILENNGTCVISRRLHHIWNLDNTDIIYNVRISKISQKTSNIWISYWTQHGEEEDAENFKIKLVDFAAELLGETCFFCNLSSLPFFNQLLTMPMKSNVGGLADLLRHRGYVDFVKATCDGRECFVADYGPMGTLLRQNILKAWWNVMVKTQKNAFPVEHANNLLIKSVESRDEAVIQRYKRLRQECVVKLPQVLKLTNRKLPLSIVSVGTCPFLGNSTPDDSGSEEQHLFLQNAIQTKLILHNYFMPSNINAVQDFWLRIRLSWWRKHSRSPECFSVASESAAPQDSSSNNNNGSQENSRTILYEFPWGKEAVESVTYLGDSLTSYIPSEKLEEYMIKVTGKKASLPACIECETSVERVMAAWLVDAYHERQTTRKKISNSKAYKVLQLHHHICPYQVAIVLSSPTIAGVEIGYICDKLENDLKRYGISVFNTSTHGASLDAHLRRNDQLGVPYTVIISQNTMTDGLVQTRSRDSQVKVTSHISNLVSNLVRNVEAELE